MQHPINNAYTSCNVPQAKGIIIFVHGLTSSKDEEMFIQAEKLFSENNYSTIRFNLYGELPGEKRLDEVDLNDHIEDVNKVIDFYKGEGYKRIFLVGHSYGGLVNLYVNHENISGILMWDASMGGPILLEDVHKDENGKYYIDWGNGDRYYISEKLYKDFQISPEEYLNKIKEVNLPIKIFGSEYGLSEAAKKYYEAANEPKELSIIKGAHHRFDDGGMDILLKESLEWINRNQS